MAAALFGEYADQVLDDYEEVRDDNDTNWCCYKYEGKKLEPAGKGDEYPDLLACCGDDDRAYAYARFETGDEMSRRAKFAFITWIGPNVSPLKKAKVSTDKAFVKAVWTQFGKEILTDDKKDLNYDLIKKTLEKASGAAYGIGK